tara:strand:+ start:162 stop:503 length:342 start_codon:yes stop_codon:yes gene_type:complete
MKISCFILALLLTSCSGKEEPRKGVLSEEAFIHVLTELHLGQAAFEINDNKNIKEEKATLKNIYASIYSKNKISAIEFQESMSYYIQDPEKLDSMYSVIIQNIEQEKATLNQR